MCNIRIPTSSNFNYQSNLVEGLLKSGVSLQENAFGQFYAGILFGNRSYQALLTCIKEQQVPLVHHCTAGKDRMGVAAVLISLILSVSE